MFRIHSILWLRFEFFLAKQKLESSNNTTSIENWCQITKTKNKFKKETKNSEWEWERKVESGNNGRQFYVIHETFVCQKHRFFFIIVVIVQCLQNFSVGICFAVSLPTPFICSVAKFWLRTSKLSLSYLIHKELSLSLCICIQRVFIMYIDDWSMHSALTIWA